MNYDVMKYIGYDHIGLDFYTAKHCNLKCRGCIRFANIAKPQFYDYDQYVLDVNKIKDLGIIPEYITISGCEHDLLFLCNGKLYTCGRSFNIKYLNKKFNLNYPEDSCIEVSSVTSPEELFTFCKTPGKLCSFCANVDSNNSQKVAWSQDPAELSDYLP